MSSRAKRVRYTPSNPPAHAAAVVSDAEDDRSPTGTANGGQNGGVGAAERKRELERNRRNLVNTRFAELEAQLSKLPGAPKRVYRRIDKEVVLKDATQGLAAQQRDLELATTRIGSMTHEIGTLRSEKLELRHDKAYLHRELANSRTENKTLQNDNLLLWQALCKSGAVKSSLPTSELSKIPVDVILGNGINNRPQNTTSATAPATTNPDTLLPPTTLAQTHQFSVDKSSPTPAPVNVQDEALKQPSVELPSDSEFFRNLSADLAASNNDPNSNSGTGEDFLKGVGGDAFSSIHHPLTSSALLSHFALENTAVEMRLSPRDEHPDIAPCG